MPRYDFACNECGAIFEKNIPYQGPIADLSCPKGHHAVRRIYSAPQVIFKGSGWYITDRRNGAKPSGSPATTQ